MIQHQYPTLWQNWKILCEKYSNDEGLILKILTKSFSIILKNGSVK
jgi:hypothetical protein